MAKHNSHCYEANGVKIISAIPYSEQQRIKRKYDKTGSDKAAIDFCLNCTKGKCYGTCDVALEMRRKAAEEARV